MGVKVGAPVKPRMTMHTNPLSPWWVTSKPSLVRTFMVARSEIEAGAALFANEISASRGIMYALSGGYFISCPNDASDEISKIKVASTKVGFFMTLSSSGLRSASCAKPGPEFATDPPIRDVCPGDFGGALYLLIRISCLVGY